MIAQSAIDSLTEEYGVWMDANGFTDPDDTGDASEMLFHPRITPEQSAWLHDFIERWESGANTDPAFYDKQTLVEA